MFDRFFFNKRCLIAIVIISFLAYLSGRREGAKKALREAHFFSEVNNVFESRHKELHNIFYLHTPKCGSSFATVLVQYACPSFPRNRTVSGPSLLEFPPGEKMNYTKFCNERFKRFQSGHAPLPRLGPMFTKENDIVTFVRNPMERIVSGFLHNFHDCNMSAMAVEFPWIVTANAPNYTALFSDEYVDDLSTVYSFYWNCVEGCASRMILGENCGNNMDKNSITCPADTRSTCESTNRRPWLSATASNSPRPSDRRQVGRRMPPNGKSWSGR
jgi:hypothetical protein